MFAYRETWVIKPRCMGQAVELLKDEINRDKPQNSDIRIYIPDLSPNVLVFEMTWESDEQHTQFWTERDTAPGAAKFFKKWHDLIERRIGTERWKLIEFK